MSLEPQRQFLRQKSWARLFRLPGLLFLVGVMQACSFSTPAPTLVPTQPALTQLPAPTQSPLFNVITIPLGVDPQGPYQTSPYYIETGGGHSLLFTTDSKKLIYDGKEVYSGDLAGFGRDSMALSLNGLHYAYVLLAAEGGNFHDLFIDGVKVATAEYLAYPAVTDDGQHYFYTACFSASGFSGSCLFKDGQDIFVHPDGILDLSISRNGDVYLASLRNFDGNNNFVESLVLNGTEIYKGHELGNGKFLSPNGEHYAYISLDENNLQHLVVDGVDQRSSDALILQQVTDQGSVCAWDSARSQVVINAKEIPSSQEGIQCALTDDASHYVINDNGWTLDGQPIQFPGVSPNDWIRLVEWTGQAWNVYRLVK